MSHGLPGPTVRAGIACVALCACTIAGRAAPGRAMDGGCTPPVEIPASRPTPVERPNPRARVDYHRLVLTWVFAFVARHGAPAACVADAAFVAGGLLPQSRSAGGEGDHPRHCIPSMPLSRATVRRHFATMPAPQLMQDSWVRYGGCAFANAWEYFDRLAELYARMRQPDLGRLAARRPTTAGAIRAAFVAANGGTHLAPHHLGVADNPPGWLDSVSICYDTRFRLTACPHPGLPDRTPLRLAGRDDSGMAASDVEGAAPLASRRRASRPEPSCPDHQPVAPRDSPTGGV